MKKLVLFVTALLLIPAFFACDNGGIDYEKMRQEELAILQEYIDRVYPGLEPTSSGLYYVNEPGTGSGDTIQVGDQVQIFYATWVLRSATDSILIDQSEGYLDGHRYEPLTVTVGAGNVVSGLDEGLTYMQEGTKSHLIINSELAYQQSGSGDGTVLPFETILMEVEVYKVKRLTTE